MLVPLDTLASRSNRRGNLSRRSLLGGIAGGVAAAALSARVPGRTIAQGSTPVASPVAAAPYRFELGSFSVTAVSDGAFSFPIPGFDMPLERLYFADAPEDELEAVLRQEGLGDWLDAPEQATATIAITPLVVDTGANLVLIDTGVGPSAPLPGTGQLLASLEAAGIAAADIDTVVFTHAHVDHVLGAVDADGALTFPNARYVMAKGEHDFWTSDERLAQVFPDAATAETAGGAFLAILPALEPSLELIDENAGGEVVPGLRLLPTYGHTPGHCAIVVGSEGNQLLATGDAITHPLHVAHPDWNFAADTLFGQGDVSRRGMLDLAAGAGMLVQVSHLPFPGLGRIVAAGDAFRWETVAGG